MNNKKSTIINFYSFKGGVGRTVTLTNIIKRMKPLNFSIAVIDLDFESPGFSLLHSSSDISIIELACRYLDKRRNGSKEAADSIVAEEIKKIPEKSKYLEFSVFAPSRDGDEISNEGFNIFVRGLKYLECNGFCKICGDFLQALCKSLQSYDYIFIDNRTGLSESAIWNVRMLADINVWLMTLNNQNIKAIKYTFDRYSTVPKNNPFKHDYSQFIFVSNIAPPIALKRKRIQELFQYSAININNLIDIPYAPKPIFEENDQDNISINTQYDVLVNAILELDNRSHISTKRYSDLFCKFHLLLVKIEDQRQETQLVKDKINNLKSSEGYKKIVEKIQSNNEDIKINLLAILFDCLERNGFYSVIIEHYFNNKDFIQHKTDKLKDKDKKPQNYNDLISVALNIAKALLICRNTKEIDYFFEILELSFLGKRIQDTITSKQTRHAINQFFNRNQKFNFQQLGNFLIIKLALLYKSYNESRDNDQLIELLSCWYLLTSLHKAVVRFKWPPENQCKYFNQLLNLYNVSVEYTNKAILEQILGCINRDIINKNFPADLLKLIEDLGQNTLKSAE
ncbi:MAG TPA: hypothetical protein ENK99_06925 [Campylobacterales bacterium]|nr:hypothetical protein [Campylobacterales bacterium]